MIWKFFNRVFIFCVLIKYLKLRKTNRHYLNRSRDFKRGEIITECLSFWEDKILKINVEQKGP